MTFERRDFLKGSLALSVAAATGARICAGADRGYVFNPQPSAWRRFEVTTHIDILTPRGAAQAWLPLPSVAASDWIYPVGDEWQVSDGKATALRVGRYGTKLLHVEWQADNVAHSARIINLVVVRDRSVDLVRPGKRKSLSASERSLFLSPTRRIPTDGIVKRTADGIVSGAPTDEKAARRLYEWVVANTYRDPKARGCGVGDIAAMLRTGNLHGKCADVNALYVGLARACGIPARDLYGIRIAPSNFGYESLGTHSAAITTAQHCRAEVYLSDWGWLPVDPADVRKVALEELPGDLPTSDPKVEAARATLFGAWESNWMAYNFGHDVPLPGSREPQIDFLMYPQAQIGGKMRDCLDPDSFKYVITSRQLS